MEPDDDAVTCEIVRALEAGDDGAAAQAHLATGHPIYYCDDSFPNAIVRRWPDGLRELVQVDDHGQTIVLQRLPPT